MIAPVSTSTAVSAPEGAEGADRGFVVELEAFSGPLDLLLHLIREQEIDITDIPIARVADQFLSVISVLELNEAADYLEMAAQLLRIKIQLLLPRPFDEEGWEDPRAELVRRLLEYEQIRELASWLVSQASRHADHFPRGWVPEAPELPPPPISLDFPGLLEAVERVIEGMPRPVIHRVVPRPLDIEGATRRIHSILSERAEFEFTDVVGPTPTVGDLLSALLALLELARLGTVRLSQPQSFGLLGITREPSDQAA